ncbi:substrate-binding periplasmic protein [Iodobacter arcticus]|uniref:Substrate-binding periplasmic protein n=1 Tax=Iodobacter arcticus TaxID=590593 RepID=A0ABW2QU63_9NEIS
MAEKSVRVCGGQSEWPPSSYYVDAQNKKIEGYSVDVLRGIFKSAGYQIEIQLLPWPRCLAEVQKGTDFQIAMATSRTAERETKFLFSQPYLYLTPGYIRHTKNATALGNNIKKCGINGFNYQAFNLASATEIDSTANNYESVVNKLKVGRCDILLEYVEVAQALLRMERHGLQNKYFKVEKLNAAPPIAAHFIVGINSNQSKETIILLNNGLDLLEKNNKLKNMLVKHTIGKP